MANPSTGWEHFHPLQFLSITQIAEYCRCPRLFFYHVGCWLDEPIPHPALTFGTGVGAGLPELTTGNPEDRVVRAFAKFQEAWGDNDNQGDEKRNSFNAMQIFRKYNEQNGVGNGLYEVIKPPESLLKSGHGISPWEVPFALYLDSLKIPLIGSVDGILRNTQTGKLYAREIKTTTEWRVSFLADNFRRNPQSFGYPWALKEMGIEHILGQPISGTVMEFISVPAPAKTARGNPKYDVSTVEIEPTELQYRSFEKWLIAKCWEIIQRIEIKNFDEDWSACASYSQFGKAGYPCRYSLLCDQSDWTTLKGMFVERQHKPFDLQNLTLEGKEISHDDQVIEEVPS